MLRLPCTCLLRSLPTPRLSVRSIHAPASAPPRIPKPRAPFDSPLSILTASKRGLEQYSDKFTTLDELFSKTGMELREQVGMTIKESKYLLRILEKYRQGFNPDQVAVKEKPKKIIRGWGPRVQNGVRIR